MIDLPTSPRPSSVTWRPVDFGGTLAGGLGGTAQRVNRLGNRWALEVTLPPMTREQAQEWSAALVKGMREGVRYAFMQPGFKSMPEGTPLVDGGSQTGDELACDGFTEGFTAKVGQFFSIVVGSRRYLHMVSATTRSSSSAFAALPIEPPLRVSPADNDVLEFSLPKIEGLLADVPAWGIDVDHITRGFSFSIEETR